MSKRLGIGLYQKRVQLAGGMDGNGLELWRALFNEYEGGDEFVKTWRPHGSANFPLDYEHSGYNPKAH